MTTKSEGPKVRMSDGRVRRSVGPRVRLSDGLAARLAALAALAAFGSVFVVLRAETPHVYAIAGARIVPAAGAPIESGTVVIRNGLIEQVGAAVSAPADARVIDGKGLTVYPGLIDLGNTAGLQVPALTPPADARTRMELERWKRGSILHPQIEAAAYVKSDAPEMQRLAAAGITTILSLPPGDVVRGRSSLLNTAIADDAPQIGNVADQRGGQYVLKTPVALHVALVDRPQGTGYPDSLFGVIAFVRQALYDAQHYQAEWARYDRVKGARRPAYDPALEALQPAIAGKLRVALEVNSALDIRRALSLAREFKLSAIVAGGQEAGEVVDELKASKVPVVFSLDLPVRSRSLAPDADEPIRTIRARVDAPKIPAELERAGVLFAFESAGLANPADFVRNAARVVRSGLPPESAVRALTIDAATLAGVADRLGSIEKGKAANLVVTEGDLFDEKTKVRHVFVDGRLIPPPVPPSERPGRAR